MPRPLLPGHARVRMAHAHANGGVGMPPGEGARCRGSVGDEMTEPLANEGSQHERVRVGVFMDGSERYGLLAFAESTLKAVDRRRFTCIGLFMGRGDARQRLAPFCDETVDLGLGPLLPLSRAGRSRYHLPTLLAKAVLFLRAVVRAARAIRRARLDVVHVHAYPVHLVAGLACRMAGVPCAWHWHGPFTRVGVAKVVARLGMGHLAAVIVCISRFVLETLPGGLDRKACVVYNGVDARGIMQSQRPGVLRSLAGVPDGVPLVGLFGAIMERKGHEYFIRAAAQVVARFSLARFVIVGGESEMCRLRYGFEARHRRLVQELGLEHAVIFAGPHPDAFRLMGDCDVICMPTVPVGLDSGEGFGLVMIEAMAAGVPVVATSCGAPPEVIEDGVSGLLVPPRDAHALAEAILRLLEDERLRCAMGEESRRRVRDAFDISRTVREMEKVYLAVAGRAG